MEKIEFIGKCLFISGRKKVLVIGDLHFGYEEYLNRTGIFVSRKMFSDAIKYLDKVFKRTGKVDFVVLLGDVKHDFGRINLQERKETREFIEYLKKNSNEILI